MTWPVRVVPIEELPDTSPELWLDEQEAVPIEPDLSVCTGDFVRWIADVKYKRLAEGKHLNADLYQLLAYTVGLNLPQGTLIYAAEEGEHAAEHVVKHGGKRLRLVAIDLDKPPGHILTQISTLLRGSSGPAVSVPGATEAVPKRHA